MSSAARRASCTAATTRSSSVSTSAGSTTDGSIRIRSRSPPPLTTAVTRPPPADAGDLRLGQRRLRALHLGLHLLGLQDDLGQVRHAWHHVGSPLLSRSVCAGPTAQLRAIGPPSSPGATVVRRRYRRRRHCAHAGECPGPDGPPMAQWHHECPQAVAAVGVAWPPLACCGCCSRPARAPTRPGGAAEQQHQRCSSSRVRPARRSPCPGLSSPVAQVAHHRVPSTPSPEPTHESAAGAGPGAGDHRRRTAADRRPRPTTRAEPEPAPAAAPSPAPAPPAPDQRRQGGRHRSGPQRRERRQPGHHQRAGGRRLRRDQALQHHRHRRPTPATPSTSSPGAWPTTCRSMLEARGSP